KEERTYGEYHWGDVLDVLKSLTPKYEGQIQLIYIDPPFFTGRTFKYRQPIGIEGWKGNRENMISHIAYVDKYDRADYFNMMEEIFRYAHRMLSDEGCLYVHID